MLTKTFDCKDFERRSEGFVGSRISQQTWVWQWTYREGSSTWKTSSTDPWGIKWGHNTCRIYWSWCPFPKGNGCLSGARFTESCNWKYKHEQPVKVNTMPNFILCLTYNLTTKNKTHTSYLEGTLMLFFCCFWLIVIKYLLLLSFTFKNDFSKTYFFNQPPKPCMMCS